MIYKKMSRKKHFAFAIIPAEVMKINMLERMNATIEYIEEHLLEELHLPTIAKVAGTSESEIQKTFYALT